jgi:RNA polymerase sigma-70 factor (ECF subfamily)
MKIEQGLSNQEIADKLHITIPTVKSHYTQAIKQLRGMIDNYYRLCKVTKTQTHESFYKQ